MLMLVKQQKLLRVLSSTFLLLCVNVSIASDYSRLIPSWLGTAVVLIVIVGSLIAFYIWKVKDFDKKWNDDEVDKNGIEKQFKDSLQALAISAEEQVAVTEPGDVPEEIIDDYLLWAESYRNNFRDTLNPEIEKEIIELEYLVNKLPESVFKETNLESMNQPEWQFLRDKAKLLLDKLNWPIESPRPYIDEGDGTFSRNLTDTEKEKGKCHMSYFKIGNTDFKIDKGFEFTYQKDGDKFIVDLEINGDEDYFETLTEDDDSKWSWAMYAPKLYLRGITIANPNSFELALTNDLLEECEIGCYMMEHCDVFGSISYKNETLEIEGDVVISGIRDKISIRLETKITDA
jgi:hypothetical protein